MAKRKTPSTAAGQPRPRRFRPGFIRSVTRGPDWVWHSIGDGTRPRPSVSSGVMWLWVLMNKFLTAPALMALPGLILLGLYSSLAQSSPSRTVFLLALVIFLADLLCGMVFLPLAAITRSLPSRVREGSVLLIRYRVYNRRLLPAFEVELDPELGFQYFEKLEAARTAVLPGRKQFLLEARYRALRRGRYQVGGARIVSRFPFGICKWSWRGDPQGAQLSVFPAYTALNTISMPTGRRFQNSGMSRISKVSEAADFHGCRDFRDGDNPRHIHWPASARSGRLILKEFQEEYLSRAALIIDTCVSTGKGWRSLLRRRAVLTSHALESALRLAAAAAEYLMKDECVVDLFAAGRTVVHFQAGRSLAPFEAVLDVLAGVEGDTEPSIARLESEVFAEIAGIGSALVILLGADRERIAFVAKLKSMGVAVKAVVISEEAATPPAGMTLLKPGDIDAGKVRNL